MTLKSVYSAWYTQGKNMIIIGLISCVFFYCVPINNPVRQGNWGVNINILFLFISLFIFFMGIVCVSIAIFKKGKLVRLKKTGQCFVAKIEEINRSDLKYHMFQFNINKPPVYAVCSYQRDEKIYKIKSGLFSFSYTNGVLKRIFSNKKMASMINEDADEYKNHKYYNGFVYKAYVYVNTDSPPEDYAVEVFEMPAEM